MTESSAKIISRGPDCVIDKNYFPRTELSAKIISQELSVRLKNELLFLFLTFHKLIKNVKFINKHIISIKMHFLVQSPIQMVPLSVKNASSKFSRFGTFKTLLLGGGGGGSLNIIILINFKI
jgi:hypothetical protein